MVMMEMCTGVVKAMNSTYARCMRWSGSNRWMIIGWRDGPLPRARKFAGLDSEGIRHPPRRRLRVRPEGVLPPTVQVYVGTSSRA